ncbi:hypothetical protein AAG570_007457 [Ranatra chinensis]|uniref:Uncharacterized protein n=1 Tax=Ranatra chinensis TaxID=642074 RepID=A0ABD0XVX5_9HEMI
MEPAEGYKSDEDLFDDGAPEGGAERRAPPTGVVPPGCDDTGEAKKRVAGLRSLMTGVPPPPQVTDPLAYDAAQILDNWHAHKGANLWWSAERKPDKRPQVICPLEALTRAFPHPNPFRTILTTSILGANDGQSVLTNPEVPT